MDKLNAFDVKLAYQFLKIENDLGKEEELRECYRHIRRVLKSEHSSGSAKYLANLVDNYNKENPKSIGDTKKNVSEVCKKILKKADVNNMFDETMAAEILKFL